MIFSILIILFTGLITGFIFERLKLPGLLGMIFGGVAVGPAGLNLLEAVVMDVAGDIRMIALVVILLRAGLGLNKNVLKEVGPAAVKMSFIPCLAEGFTVMMVACLILDIPVVEGGMLGFIVAAVSPAVLVPSMLYLKEKKMGMDKGVPVILLAGASVDDVIAITMFTAFLGMAMHTGQVALMQIVFIPLQIAGGILLGGLSGYLLFRLSAVKTLRLSSLEWLTLIIAAALFILLAGEKTGLAGLLGVMTLGFILLEKAPHKAGGATKGLEKAWFFARIFLFVLIGAQVDLSVAWQAGLAGLLIIGAGLLARTAGVWLALAGSSLNLREKAFSAIAYSPKATVQAAIGGIPLAMGIESGNLILAISVLAIVVTAPLGAMGIHAAAPYLLNSEKRHF